MSSKISLLNKCSWTTPTGPDEDALHSPTQVEELFLLPFLLADPSCFLTRNHRCVSRCEYSEPLQRFRDADHWPHAEARRKPEKCFLISSYISTTSTLLETWRNFSIKHNINFTTNFRWNIHMGYLDDIFRQNISKKLYMKYSHGIFRQNI